MNRKTKGTIITLIGVTALASAFAATDGVGAQNTSSETKQNGRNGFGKTLTEAEKTERQTNMATNLSLVLGLQQSDVLKDLQAGKNLKDIISASGKDEGTVMTALKEKRETEMKARLATDVSSGKITQAQADEILSHKGGHDGGEGRGKNSENMISNLASILGADIATINSKISSGKTIKDIVAESGMNETDVRTKMQALHETEIKAKLGEEVSSGKITQAQADERLTEMKKRDVERKVSRDSGTQTNTQ